MDLSDQQINEARLRAERIIAKDYRRDDVTWLILFLRDYNCYSIRDLGDFVAHGNRNPKKGVTCKHVAEQILGLRAHLKQSTPVTVSTIFNSDGLINDMCQALLKAGVISANKVTQFLNFRNFLSIYAISCMHNSILSLGKNDKSRLTAAFSGKSDGNELEVYQTFQIELGRNIFCRTRVLSTSLNAIEYCDQKLMDAAIYGNQNNDNPAHWEVPIELTANWKLTQLD